MKKSMIDINFLDEIPAAKPAKTTKMVIKQDEKIKTENVCGFDLSTKVSDFATKLGRDLSMSREGRADRAAQSLNNSAQYMLAAGVDLLALKSDCEHGEFTALLTARGLEERTAQSAMRYVRFLLSRDENEREKLLGLPKSHVLAIASADPEVIDDLLQNEDQELKDLGSIDHSTWTRHVSPSANAGVGQAKSLASDKHRANRHIRISNLFYRYHTKINRMWITIALLCGSGVSHAAIICDDWFADGMQFWFTAPAAGAAGSPLTTQTWHLMSSCTGLPPSTTFNVVVKGVGINSGVPGQDPTKNSGANVHYSYGGRVLTGLGFGSIDTGIQATSDASGRLTWELSGVEGTLYRSNAPLTTEPLLIQIADIELHRVGGGSGPYSGGLLHVDGLVTLLAKPTCNVASSSRDNLVNMNTHRTPDIENQGGVTPWVDFNLTLNCGGSTGGGTTGVHITITDLNDPGNRSTELPIVHGGTSAGGVAVQISRTDAGHAMVSFGPDSPGIGGDGQWKAGDVAADPIYRIPLSARYIKTGPITPGIANAVATFTMAYD